MENNFKSQFFRLGFGNASLQLSGNRYYNLSIESGAWGCDQDAESFSGHPLASIPGFGGNVRLSRKINVFGYPLDYDFCGNLRPQFANPVPYEIVDGTRQLPPMVEDQQQTIRLLLASTKKTLWNRNFELK